MTENERPLPEPNVDTQPFWEAARAHILKLQRCRDCGQFRYYPRPVCPHCMSFEYDWLPVSGRGTVYTYTVIHRAPHPGFRARVPFIMAVVELEEGPRMLTNLVDIAPEAARIGQPVQVVFEDVSDTISLPQFRPLSEE